MRFYSGLIKAHIIGFCFGVISVTVQAGEITSWLNPLSGDWDDSTKWSLPNYPTGGIHDAIINAAGSAYRVTLDRPITLDNLTLDSPDATLTVSPGGTMAVAGTATLMDGTLKLDGGSLTGGTWDFTQGATFTSSGSSDNFIASEATILGNLNMLLTNVMFQSSQSITGDTVNITGPYIQAIGFQGSQTISGKTFNLHGTFTNHFSIDGDLATVTLDTDTTVQGKGHISNRFARGQQTLINQGAIISNTGGTLLIDSSIHSLINETDGRMQSNAGTLSIIAENFINRGLVEAVLSNIIIASPQWINEGNITIQPANTITLYGNFSNRGQINMLAANSTLTLYDPISTDDLGVINNPHGGTVNIGGKWDNTNMQFNLTANHGHFVLSSTISGGVIRPDPNGDYLTFNTTNYNFLADGLIWDGDLNLIGNVRLRDNAQITGQNINITPGSRLSFDQSSTLQGKTITLQGVLSIEDNHTLTLANDTTLSGSGSIDRVHLRSDSKLINHGTIHANRPASLKITEYIVNFTNQSSGTLQATQGASLIIEAADFINHGTVHAKDASTIIFASDQWTNHAQILATDGATLQFGRDRNDVTNWTNLGDIIIDATSTLELNGIYSTVNLGNLDNSAGGTVRLTGEWILQGQHHNLSNQSGQWILDDLVIRGGSLTTGVIGQNLQADNTQITFTDGFALQGSINLNNSVLNLHYGATINGPNVNMIGDGVQSLNITSTQTLNNLTINMNGDTSYLSVSNNSTLTLGPLSKVRGKGQIGGNRNGYEALRNYGVIHAALSEQLTFTQELDSLTNQTNAQINASNNSTLNIESNLFFNYGQINATDGATINIHARNWINDGDITAQNGANLNFNFNWANSGAITVGADSTLTLGGVFSTQGLGQIHDAGGSIIITGDWFNGNSTVVVNERWLLDGGVIRGGILTIQPDMQPMVISGDSNNTFSQGLVYQADVLLNDNARLNFKGGATFTGSTARLTGFGRQTLSFTDTLQLDNKNIYLEGSNSTLTFAGSYGNTTFGANTTIQGKGTITGSRRLNNHGLVRAHLGETLEISQLVSFNNLGVVEASNGATLHFEPSSIIFRPYSKIINVNNGVLTGGVWRVFSNSTISMSYAELHTLDADLTLSGSNSKFIINKNGYTLESQLLHITPNGALKLLQQRDFTSTVNQTLTIDGNIQLDNASFNAYSLPLIKLNGQINGNGAINAYRVETSDNAQININTGTLEINAILQHNGVIDTPQDATLRLNKQVSGAGNYLNQGAVQLLGDFSPGVGSDLNATAAIHFGGDLTYLPNDNTQRTLTLQLRGLIPGEEHDQINVAGQLTLPDILQIEMLADYSPAPLDVFTLATFGSLANNFEEVLGQQLDSGFLLIPEITEHAYQLVTAIPADFDLNGQVDVADLSIWATGFGNTNATFQLGDANLDGQVDVSDLSIWATRFGSTAADFTAPILATLNSATAIPEPSSLLLMGLGVLVVVRRKAKAA